MAKIFTKRSKEEIEKELKRICEDSDNFTSDNYGSESADNGIYELNYSEFATENTLRNFLKFLFEEKI